jgi:hypothetical protein
MCELCDKAKQIPEYAAFLDGMLAEDQKRLEQAKKFKEKFDFLFAYSSVNYPIKLRYPLFEARAPYAVPHNYYQQLFIDEKQAGISFAHGSMRSLFFSGNRLMLFSKSVGHAEGEEFFNSFLLLHLEPNEYSYEWKGQDLVITADVRKNVIDLLSADNSRKSVHVKFLFTGANVLNRIVSRERVVNSSHLKSVYEKYSSLDKKMASVDMEGYAVTVPHLSPHPYMLQLAKSFGYEDGRAMQEKMATDYLKKHLA